MQVSQPLEIYNDDQTSHNIHPLARVNPEWKQVAAHRGAADPHRVGEAGVHSGQMQRPPMDARLVLGAHDLALCVTGEDGAFTVKGLPPGKYTLTAWQEQFGTQTQDVTIGGTETKTVDFVFKARAY